MYAIHLTLEPRHGSAVRTILGADEADVRRVLGSEGFTDDGDGLYVGCGDDPVRCVLAVQRLARELPWFPAAVRRARLLRITDDDDLTAAIGDLRAAPRAKPSNPL